VDWFARIIIKEVQTFLLGDRFYEALRRQLSVVRHQLQKQAIHSESII
jgi:hypothetical protein